MIHFSSSTHLNLSYFAGQRDSSMIFSDEEMKHMSSVLCNVVIGIIKIIYPYGSQAFTRQRIAALMKKDEFYPKKKWNKLLKVGIL